MGYDEPGRRIYNLFSETMFRDASGQVPGHRLHRELRAPDARRHRQVPRPDVRPEQHDLRGRRRLRRRGGVREDPRRRSRSSSASRSTCRRSPRSRRSSGGASCEKQRDLDMAYVHDGLPHGARSPTRTSTRSTSCRTSLSEGQSSRLHQRLVDELGSSTASRRGRTRRPTTPASFVCLMQLDPANIDAAIEVVLEEIYAITDKKVTTDELEKAKKLKTAEFWLRAGRTSRALAASLGTSETRRGQPGLRRALRRAHPGRHGRARSRTSRAVLLRRQPRHRHPRAVRGDEEMADAAVDRRRAEVGDIREARARQRTHACSSRRTTPTRSSPSAATRSAGARRSRTAAGLAQLRRRT